jgi:branched-chain amino acid transport system permease protein
MAVVGGLGSVSGSFLGAAFVVLVPELLRGLGAFYPMVYGLAMILIFVFWPRGLVGFVELIGRRIGVALSFPPRRASVSPGKIGEK